MNVVVVGGGTAGWMTALMTANRLPSATITVIESEEIGILGAGEGTTPSFVSFLEEVGIDVSDLIKKTSSTLKNGIKFTNWNKDSGYYYHNFLCREESLSDAFYPHPYFHVSSEVPQKSLDFGSLLNEKLSSPFVGEPPFSSLLNYGIHFNAKKVAEYLKNVSISRGIQRVEGKVVQLNTNSADNVTSLVLNSGIVIESEFIFDCTGFFRLIIGKYFKSNWISHSTKLPLDSALPFFLPVSSLDELPPYTESIAMKYGWMWKIPLQDRYGCGYVYDSTYITEQEAVEEVEKYLGFEPTYPRTDKGSFKFNAGFYETPWVKNCVAVGLSSGFIEPLEATSIWTSYTFVKEVLFKLENYTEDTVKYFNQMFVDWNSDIANFLYLHYMGSREDTPFWNSFKDISKAPKEVKKWLEDWNKKGIIYQKVNGIAFQNHNWFLIGYGLGLISVEKTYIYIEENDLHELLPLYNNLQSYQKTMSELTLSHSEYLRSNLCN